MFRLDNAEEFNTGDSTTEPTDPTTPPSGSIDGQGILIINARDDSSELNKFLDLLNNPCNYKGRVVYLTAIGPTSRPDPFLWADKFYFNEGCEWYESPFALGALLDDLE
jgi:hypothetical protein